MNSGKNAMIDDLLDHIFVELIKRNLFFSPRKDNSQFVDVVKGESLVCSFGKSGHSSFYLYGADIPVMQIPDSLSEHPTIQRISAIHDEFDIEIVKKSVNKIKERL